MKLYNVTYNAKSMMHYKYKSTFAIDYNKPVIVSKVCLIKNQNMQQHLTHLIFHHSKMDNVIDEFIGSAQTLVYEDILFLRRMYGCSKF